MVEKARPKAKNLRSDANEGGESSFSIFPFFFVIFRLFLLTGEGRGKILLLGVFN